MSNGVEISQQAIPLKRAADYQKALDSRWKLLEILQEKVFNFTFATTDITGAGLAWVKICDNPTGFITPFEFIATDAYAKDAYTVYSMLDGYYLQLRQSGAATAVTMSLFLRIYNLDITQTFQAPPDTTLPGNGRDQAQYGLRILQGSRTNHGMQETEMSHFSANTSAKPFSVHMHGLKTTVAGNINLNHRLGYLPTFFVAAYAATLSLVFGYPDYLLNKPYVTGFGTTTVAAHADTTSINLTGAGVVLSGTYAVLILKDPVLVSA